ncbi:MAG: transcription elongation factor GreA [Ignavibacteriae bacterium]|nr:transcription elongation factor GreA [Ignavibacteriota bacterium]MCB9242938.1 transcription elongation factor GreA [Ignavibacteriales bacterium]
MSQGTVYLTKKRLAELEEDLRHLRLNARKEVAERIAEARSHGDLSENAEYDAAKEEQSHLEMKISKLENLLSRVKVLENHEIPDGKVSILSIVKVLDVSYNEEVTFNMVSPEEADFEQDKISITSPIGQALLGKAVNEVIIVEAQEGKSEYKILEISKQS